MEMESQVVNRRMKMIVAHFTATKGVLASHLSPLNCSGGISSVVQRCDNRMLFARQGSTSQACFMRQVPIRETFGERDSSQPAVAPGGVASVKKDPPSDVVTTPLFSKSAQAQDDLPKTVERRPVKEECQLSMADPPMFSRPSKGLKGHKQFSPEKVTNVSESNGLELSPQMDVAETRYNYIMIVELPGVSINDIRVEIKNHNLTVTGKRSTRWWRVACGSQDSSPNSHKKILQGPYKVVLPLPSDVKEDSISAEFMNGFLQITLPKR